MPTVRPFAKTVAAKAQLGLRASLEELVRRPLPCSTDMAAETLCRSPPALGRRLTHRDWRSLAAPGRNGPDDSRLDGVAGAERARPASWLSRLPNGE